MNKIRVKRGQVWSEMHRFLWYFSVFGCFILVFFWYSSITERFGSKRVYMHVLTKAWGFCLVQSPLGMFFRKFMFISYGMLLDARYWICAQWLWIQCIRWINIYCYKFYMLVWLTNSFSIANALQYFRMSFLGTSHLLLCLAFPFRLFTINSIIVICIAALRCSVSYWILEKCDFTRK